MSVRRAPASQVSSRDSIDRNDSLAGRSMSVLSTTSPITLFRARLRSASGRRAVALMMGAGLSRGVFQIGFGHDVVAFKD